MPIWTQQSLLNRVVGNPLQRREPGILGMRAASKLFDD